MSYIQAGHFNIYTSLSEIQRIIYSTYLNTVNATNAFNADIF